MGAVKASTHGCAGRNEEPVAVLVIDRLAMRRVIRAQPGPVAARASVHNDRISVGARPLPMLHCCYCTRLWFGLLLGIQFSLSSDESSSRELSGKRTLFSARAL